MLNVALFTRAWIEIARYLVDYPIRIVALFTRAWIEIFSKCYVYRSWRVALFTRAWIEIDYDLSYSNPMMSPSLRGRGLKYERFFYGYIEKRVALFTRAWIEITGASFV